VNNRATAKGQKVFIYLLTRVLFEQGENELFDIYHTEKFEAKLV
jgi:hypothetical protein